MRSAALVTTILLLSTSLAASAEPGHGRATSTKASSRTDDRRGTPARVVDLARVSRPTPSPSPTPHRRGRDDRDRRDQDRHGPERDRTDARRADRPAVVYEPVVLTETPPAVLWQDSADLSRASDWTESRFDPPPMSGDLQLEVDGTAEVDTVELAFTDGTTRVIDFGGGALAPGTYELATIAPLEAVDHLRVVSRTADAFARLTARFVD